ncbi:putative mitochondrial outer membrane protein iml2 protein [Phialemonium atrogriseum]|uniref:Inclusion body clearance protein IML2 n=1 Tax=Phialemonium atrogriseum TaxID=1093897 RepID=A0AAJ0C2S4_9PEZI|nr:putative mitochondrial outer membrane protein iml2 protein [Phialemonium atrogriseum]KAK1768048.1 putative mitochondrial outer membrane protein iml2 protein [Phialemonium atrogriseum]
MSSLRTWLRGSSSTTSSTTTITLNQSTLPCEIALNDTNRTNAAKLSILVAEQEAADMEDAMAAAGLIMNDDIEGAEARLELRKDSSTFHLFALGVSTFMKSILGFEKGIMAEASCRLSECETRAWADLKRAQREADKATGGGYWYGRSAGASDVTAENIFPPGCEYALVHAEAQLMNAVVGVMHESLTEGIKGFYKLRKAFITLEGIMESEAKALKQVQGGTTPGQLSDTKRTRSRMSSDMMPGSFDEAEFVDFEETSEKGSDSDAEFVDASAGLSGTQTPSSVAGLNKPVGPASTSRPSTPAVERILAEPSSTSSGPLDGRNHMRNTSRSSSRPATPSLNPLAAQSVSQTPPRPVSAHKKTTGGADAGLFTSTRDIFVHSGANMCFGALLLIISMVPPAFSRLLHIVGFRGDRDRGVQMLWQSTKFPNVNGAVAGLILLGYYNALLTFADILPSDRDVEELTKPEAEGGEIVGYPKERCRALLADMRTRYPDSRLWRLEEARVLANNRRLDEAIRTLCDTSDSNMRQITALNAFELSINAMFAMDWPLARKSFLRCVELNEWSHTIYFYMVGCAELEQYRDAYHRAASLAAAATAAEEAGGEAEEAQRQRQLQLGEARAAARQHKKAAEEFFRKAPAVAGRKRFLSRQMPVEVFASRKLRKWEERAAALGGGVDLADAVGVSPAMEMVYVWNGSKRMSPALLERAAALLPWERCTAPPDKVARIREEADEVGIQAVIEASLLRCQGRVDDTRAALEPTLKLDRSVFKGPTRDDYVLAAAHYEIAAVAWVEACNSQHWPPGASDEEIGSYRRHKVDECQEHLQKVARWEGFVLDARFGMRVQAGLDSVRWLKGKKEWV